jgi:hypothetical protein
VIRGRYFIERRVSLDDICITYLAQDRAASNKRVIFKVLALGSDFIENSTEERIALSHLNHPHIVKILDSGEMPEGMPFAVFEYVEGSSLREMLDSGDPIPAVEAARIAKQISEALSGAQQNGVLHYDVRPQKVILKPEVDGSTIAKVTDFVLAKGYKAPSVRKLKDVAYQAPEQLQGKTLSPASESYSLAAITYEMLTGRLPFNFESMRELLDAQKRGLQTKPRMIKAELPAAVDDIFVRALAYDPNTRYQKSRDFGEALYNAVGSAVPVYVMDGPEVGTEEEILALDDEITKESVAPAVAEEILELSPKPEPVAQAAVQATPDKAWEKHSPEPSGMSVWALATVGLLGLILIGVSVFIYINYFSGGPAAPVVADAGNQTDPLAGDQQNTAPQADPTQDIEAAPPARVIEQPQGTERFLNSKDAVAPGLLKNFRGFSLYYPSGWIKNPSEKNFLDISKTDNGVPVEQMLAMALKKNLANTIPNFKGLSEGQQFINNNRPVYEVKFEGNGKVNDEELKIWGRTLFFPAGRFGVRNGFMITMLATSRSEDVKSADDVGTKGQLKDILYTLEPDSLDVSY